MAEQFKHLFSPIKVGNITIPNRIVVPGHFPALRDPDMLPGERLTAYWESKAKGGVGMVCSGIWSVHKSAPPHGDYDTPLQTPGGIEKLKKAAGRIQQHGTKMFIQLWHGGANSYGVGTQVWAPSEIQTATGSKTHAMTNDEVKEVIEGFAAEAYRGQQAGLDGVEIHGAHGYLITQFMSPQTNHRTDEYGGDHAGRIKFACDIIDAIRASVGKDFAVGIRISADPISGGGYTLDDTKIFAEMLTRSGNLDYIATGAGIPPMYYPLGSLMYHAAGIKEVVDIPVIGGGRVTDPVQAEQILEDNQADLLFMNRALICDPEMPNKAREGRLEEIRHCMGCSEGCWMRVSQDGNPQGISCTYNPTAGKEERPGWLEMVPAEKKKKVMVIGGGPAGLETARVAKSRGHDVTLWEKGDALGGMTLVGAKAPGREELLEMSRYYIYQMKLLDVDVRLNSSVTTETVKGENPDVVVVATGSIPMIAKDIPGIDQDNVIKHVRGVLSGEGDVGENVLIVDNQRHIEGLATADFLADQGKKVEVIYPLDSPAPFMESITKMALRQRLGWGDVKLTPGLHLLSISGNSVTLGIVEQADGRSILSDKVGRVIEGVDTIILSYGGVEDNDLYYALKDEYPEVYAAGDCNGVRKMLWAVNDGATIARKI
ncbi:MAG: FAD-dependent oxidoreductase [Desulfobacterales bacterium]